nr:altered inheritance of mitochondria protein 41, mitochondrial [Quercus suber]
MCRSRLSLRPGYICPQCRTNATSTIAPASPLLLKLRTDLKTAMRSKDTARLSVLRSLLAEITNAAKTSKPVTTDLQLLSLLRKRAAAAKAAGEEFRIAGREDLVKKEEQQAKVIEEYAESVDTVGETEIRNAVVMAVEEIKKEAGDKVVMGDVLKRLLALGGSLDGKPVEKAQVAAMVKRVLGQVIPWNAGCSDKVAHNLSSRALLTPRHDRFRCNRVFGVRILSYGFDQVRRLGTLSNWRF